MGSSLLPRLLCAAIALESQWPTLGRADAGVAVQPPLHAALNNDPAPRPVGSGTPGASLQLSGGPAAVRLEARRTSVARALATLGAAYHISIRTTVTLDELRDGTYMGSLRYVIARLLDGYNYIIEQNHTATLDVFVVGRSDGKATPAPTMPVVRQHRIPVTYRISRVRP